MPLPHVTVRGEGGGIVEDDEDRRVFLQTLSKMIIQAKDKALDGYGYRERKSP